MFAVKLGDFMDYSKKIIAGKNSLSNP